MSARTSFCALAIALAATWLLLPPRHTPAQAPPGESKDQRLQRLEDKIDMLVTALAELQRGSANRSSPAEGTALAALHLARDRFRQEVEAATRQVSEVGQKSPSLSKGSPGLDAYLERLAKTEKRRSDLQIELTELQTNYALAEHAYKKDGKAAALSMLATMGVTVTTAEATARLDKQLINLTVLRKKLATSVGQNHPDMRALDEQIDMIQKLYGRGFAGSVIVSDPKQQPGDSDIAQVILAAVKAEIDSKKQLLQSLTSTTSTFEQEIKDAFEVQRYALEERRAQANLLAARSNLDTVLRAIAEIESRRGPN